MPKRFSVAVKARALALLAEGKNATEAAAVLATELADAPDPATVWRWAKALAIRLKPGRRPGPGKKYSPNRANIVACHDRGLTQSETVAELHLSRSLVSKHWPQPASK